MCGGCGGGGGRDWASAAVAGPAARSVAAAVATALLRAVGEPSRVTASGTGWLVASPTGAVTVASTLTALWASVPALARRVAAAGMPGLGELPGAPAPAAGPRAPGARPPGGGSDAAGGAAAGGLPGRRVAVLVGDPQAPELSWADVVVGAGVTGQDASVAVAAVDAAAAGARVLLRCASDTEAGAVLSALAAPGPAQRSTTTAVVARARAAHPWADDLDALVDPGGGAVLAVLEGAVPPAGGRTAGALVRCPGVHPAAAACWGAAALAAGCATGTRLRLVVDDDRAVVDLLGSSAVGLRLS